MSLADGHTESNSRIDAVPIVGAGLATMGLAHLVRPAMFDSIVAPAFPRNTRRHIYVNGSIETLLGAGLVPRASRRIATVGLAGYVAYVAANAVRNR
ncbi:hypothetical protein [Mycobacterium sp. 94-17]|uniref:hypothetical protein n=1 Tax=Mycobacterium sp. 94-17 TaxID=2986147 RepID=UPI002D1ECDCC|nr:hypothetical protein [Mycobacterium sp. 94-17]MEB4209557.1 hypothetical protein [Mycobacterium sp. 94-17]